MLRAEGKQQSIIRHLPTEVSDSDVIRGTNHYVYYPAMKYMHPRPIMTRRSVGARRKNGKTCKIAVSTHSAHLRESVHQWTFYASSTRDFCRYHNDIAVNVEQYGITKSRQLVLFP